MNEPTPLLAVSRHPLGLPPGSVRAVLTLMIAGLFWLILLLPEDKPVRVPLYLHGLLGMVLLFFMAHGPSIDPSGTRHPSPWWLPRGFFRLILVLGFVAAVAWAYHRNPDLLRRRLTPSPEEIEEWPNLLLAIGIGFLAGRLMSLGPWRHSPVIQDLRAWVSLIAMLGLVAAVVIEVFINPELPEKLDLPRWHAILTGIVVYYFAARS